MASINRDAEGKGRRVTIMQYVYTRTYTLAHKIAKEQNETMNNSSRC